MFAAVAGVALAAVIAGDLRAGPRGGGNVVAREIARRQQQIEEAHRLIQSGDQQRADGKLEEAVVSYRAAFTGMSKSPMTEETRDLALARFASCSVEWAEVLIEGAEFDNATAAVDAVLEQDFAPDYKPARKLKRQLDDPEYYNRALTPQHLKNVAEVDRLLRLANDFIEIASFDEAITTYNAVLRIDPTNVTARRGMEDAEAAMIAYHRSSRDHTRAKMLREVEEAWETSVPLADFVLEGLETRAGIGSERASESIQNFMDTTAVPIVDFEDASLEEVVEFLTGKSRQLDPAQKGVNFVLDLAADDSTARNARVNLKLANVPLSEIVKYITRDTGTKAVVEQFAVRIVSLSSASDILITRHYTVPPDFLSTLPGDEAEGVDDPFAPAADTGGGLKLRRVTAKEFFSKMGIPFPDGATAFYNPVGSQLTVRNTRTHLDTIEELIASARKTGPRQVEIRAVMIEVNETSLRELGFDWMVGQANAPGSDRVFFSGGTQGATEHPIAGDNVRLDYPFVPPGTNVPLGTHPVTAGNRTGGVAQPENSLDAFLNSSNELQPLTTRAPGILGIGGALTDPNFQVVVRALRQTGKADVMATPSTVTRPGQRATIEVSREFLYPTEYDPPEVPQDFLQFGGGGLFIDPVTGLPSTIGDAGSFPVTPAHPTAFEMRPVGTRLEVEPIIGNDNYTIDLVIAPEIVRFEGFINYGSPIFAGQNLVTSNEILMPVFNTIKESTSVTIYDGQTAVIGGLVNDIVTVTEDRTPGVSSIPLLGTFFRAKTSKRERKAIILMVRARIIDAAGQPVNVARR